MRIFVAIVIPQSVRRALLRIVEPKMKEFPFLKWVEPENWHITLRFLGETDEPMVEKVKRSLKNGVSSYRPFEVEFGEFGTFPPRGKLRVFWLGLRRGGEEMIKLAGIIEEKMVSLGFPREERGFTPHMTLARARRGERRQVSLEDIGLKETKLPPFWVREVVLMESKLRPEGPIYREVESFKLVGGR
jgi:2'-5' RNA ligase